jgi:putative transposase
VVKKEPACSREERRQWIERDHTQLTIERQCELLGLARSSYYYQACPESSETLDLLRRLDQLHLHFPY